MPEDSNNGGVWHHVRRALPVVAIFVAVATIYWPVMHGGWLWDDNTEITRNLDLRGPDALWKIWFAPASPDYFPIKSTVQWVQWQLWGDGTTTGYHLTNAFFHALAALLLGRALTRLGVRNAWWGAALFAVHPLAVESVAWIAEMKNSLSLVTLLLALNAYLGFDEYRSLRSYIGSILWFVVAMLSKSAVVMFPCFLLLHAWWKRARLEKRDLRVCAPYFFVSLVLGVVAVWFQNRRAIGGWDLPALSWVERFSDAGSAMLFYGGKVLWPFDLLPIYSTWSQNDFILGFLVWAFLGLAIGLIWSNRHSWGRHILLGTGWFGFHLVPVLGFVPMSYLKIAPVADHFVYLSLAGGVGLIAVGLDRLTSVQSQRFPRLVLLGAAALFYVWLYQSYGYAKVFSGSETMWRYTVRQNPAAWLAHNNLSVILFDKKKSKEAEQHARAAVQLNPRYAPARVNLGNACGANGNWTEAIEHYTEALSLEADSFEAHFNLANTLVRTGQLPEAVEHYEAALRISPTAGDAHFNLANTLVSLGRWAAAVNQYSAVLAVRADAFEARVNRGNVYAATGHLAEAKADFEAALGERPASPEVLFSLADLLVDAGQLADALPRYQQAIQLEPENSDLHRSYAAALKRAGRSSEAELQIETAVRIEAGGVDRRASQ